MISRVSQSMLFRDMLSGVGRLQSRLVDAQDEVSSGRRLREPSDDPTGLARAVRLHSRISDLGAVSDDVAFGTMVLGLQDTAIEDAEALLIRAQEIASQHANGLTTTDERVQAASEVAELESGLISIANTSVGGRYVFGGLATGETPFVQLEDTGFDPLDPYRGSAEAFSIRSGPDGSTTRITTPGDQVFNQAIAVLDELRLTLEAGDDSAASVDAIEAASIALSDERASVGGRARRLEDRDTEIDRLLDRSEAALSDIESADVAESITELTRLQLALEATLESSKVLQTSILDHLRL